MKKLVITYLFLLCGVLIFAQAAAPSDDLFFKGTLSEAKAKAKAEDKRVMIMLSATFCGPCKRLEKEVYPTPEFRDVRDRNNLILIYYHDLDKNDPDKIRPDYQIAAYPCFIVLDSDGKEMVRIAGNGASKEIFCNKLNAVLQPQNTHDARKKLLEEDPSTALNYIQFLREAFLKEELEETLYKLLEKGPLENYFTEQWWQMYYDYATYIDSGIIRYMVDHPEKVVAVIGQEKYNQFLYDRGLKMIDMRVSGSHKKYDQVRRIIKFIDVHPQLETPLSRFFKKNIDLAEKGNGVKLFNKTIPWIKKADTESRKVLWGISFSGLTTIEHKELEQYMIRSLEECLKYELDEKAKSEYANTLNYLKK